METSTKVNLRRYLRTGATLSEALPYMRQFAGETFVIKYGGHAMGDADLSLNFARDVVLIKQVGINPIVVHGGGPQIGAMLKRLQIESTFVDGLRVTDRATVEVVEMVLSGTINKQIVTTIGTAGGKAIGISGKDGRLIEARKLEHQGPGARQDLGFVGEPVKVNAELLDSLARLAVIPVIAPIGIGADGETYNINADSAAGAVAAAVNARKLLMLTAVSGVLNTEDELIAALSAAEARRLIAGGTIEGGMIPKVETCLDAVAHGVGAAHILDGRIPHVMLLEIFTEQGVGTMLQAE